MARLVESDRFAKVKSGDVLSLAWPTGMEAEALDILVLSRRPDAAEARKAGAKLAKLADNRDVLAELVSWTAEAKVTIL